MPANSAEEKRPMVIIQGNAPETLDPGQMLRQADAFSGTQEELFISPPGPRTLLPIVSTTIVHRRLC